MPEQLWILLSIGEDLKYSEPRLLSTVFETATLKISLSYSCRSHHTLSLGIRTFAPSFSEQEGRVVTNLAQSSLRPLSTRATMSHHARTTPSERRPVHCCIRQQFYGTLTSDECHLAYVSLGVSFACWVPVTKCSIDNLITIAVQGVQGDSVSIPFDFFCEDGAPFANVTPRIAIPSRGVLCRNLRKNADIYLEQPVSIEKHHCVRPQIYTLQDLRC